MLAVRTLLVVELPPALDQDLRFSKVAESLAVQQLTAQLALAIRSPCALSDKDYRRCESSG